MVVSLDQTQQKRVYNSFHRTWYWIKQTQMNEITRRQQMGKSRSILQQRMNEEDLQGLHLQDAMIEYLLLREHEDSLHLPRTCVPVLLLPHFQNISYPDLQAVVKRLAVFPAYTVQVNPSQPKSVFEALIESYDAVRAGRITDPETIRKIALCFLEIEYDPEANKNSPFDAGEAARILIRRAKLYEEHGIPGDTHKI
jgi:hypothetical protein